MDQAEIIKKSVILFWVGEIAVIDILHDYYC